MTNILTTLTNIFNYHNDLHKIETFQKQETPQTPQLGQIASTNTLGRLISITNKMLQSNPSKISLQEFDNMKAHPTVAFALEFCKMPIMTVNWKIKSESNEIASYVDNNLRELWDQFIYDMLLAFDFGFSPFEKVWGIDEKTGKYKYRKLLCLPAKTVKIQITEDGSYNGFVQHIGLSALSSSNNGNSGEGRIYVPREKSFVYTYKKEYGNYYGIARTRPAYTPWYIHRYVIEFTNTYYERFGNPPIIGFAPPGSSNREGVTVDNMKIMEEIINSVQNNTGIILPFDSTKDGTKRFSLELLEAKRSGADYMDYLKYLDSLIMRAIVLPDIAYSTEEKGSHASFVERIALFAEVNDAILRQIKFHIDNYVIKQLVEINWGKNAPRTEWTFQSLSTKDKELVKQLMFALVQNGVFDIPVTWLKEQIQMPELETGNVQDIKIPENTMNKQVPNFIRKDKNIQFKRKPNKSEQHINFAKIEKRFNLAESQIIEKANEIIDKQKEAMIKDIEKAIEENKIRDIQDIDIKYKKEYEDLMTTMLEEMFEGGIDDVREEHNLPDFSIPALAMAWVVTQAQNIANKHMDDLRFNAVNSAMKGVSKEESIKEILTGVRNEFNDYIDDKLEISSSMAVHKFYEDGREWSAEKGGLTYATWSAVLDNRVCEFCAGRDEMTIRTDDPEFAKYSPGDVHENCRCIWIFQEEEPEEGITWKTPTKNQIEEYYQ